MHSNFFKLSDSKKKLVTHERSRHPQEPASGDTRFGIVDYSCERVAKNFLNHQMYSCEISNCKKHLLFPIWTVCGFLVNVWNDERKMAWWAARGSQSMTKRQRRLFICGNQSVPQFKLLTHFKPNHPHEWSSWVASTSRQIDLMLLDTLAWRKLDLFEHASHLVGFLVERFLCLCSSNIF